MSSSDTSIEVEGRAAGATAFVVKADCGLAIWCTVAVVLRSWRLLGKEESIVAQVTPGRICVVSTLRFASAKSILSVVLM